MGIYVLGMHRSGTSALARVVGLLVDFDGGQHAGPHNVAGHWEDPRLNFTLDEVLRDAERDWSTPPADDVDPADTRQELRDRLHHIVTDMGAKNWVLKDPRLCLTLPLLLDAPQPAPTFIATYRNPIEVARSLHQRDGLPVGYGLALWEIYSRSMLLTLARRRPALTVSFAGLMVEPSATVQRVAHFLGALGYDIPTERLNAAASSIRPELQHETATDDSRLNDAQKTLLSLLEASTRGQHVSVEDIPAPDLMTLDLIATRRPFGRIARDLNVLRKRTRRIAPLFRTRDAVLHKLNRPVPHDPWRDEAPW